MKFQILNWDALIYFDDSSLTKFFESCILKFMLKANRITLCGVYHVLNRANRRRQIFRKDDAHYLTVLRYIEANSLRAGIVEKAELLQWSSFAIRNGEEW